MRILVLSHEYPPVGGGGGQVAKDLSEGFAALGHEVKVLTADLLGGVDREDPGSDSPLEVIRVKTLRKDPARASMLAMITFLTAAVFRGMAVILRWKPDVIHVHFAVPAGPAAWLLSKITGVPYLLTVHLGDVPGGTPEKTDRWFRVVKPFTYPIWQEAGRVIAVSQYTRQLAQKSYPVPVEVIHNGIDLELYPVEEVVVHQPPRIVFAGRFVPQKNPLLVIRTMGELADLDWELTMLGDGALYEQVKQEVHDLGLEDRVRLPGWVDPEEVRKEFLRSDILFLPSRSEGLPVVGLQALAAGLAFVVSDIGGFVDLVSEGKNGYRVPLDLPLVSIGNILRLIITNQNQLESFKKQSLDFRTKFDLQQIIKQYETKIEGV